MKLPHGGLIAIIDDGSPLFDALRAELGARGFRTRPVAAGDPHQLAADEDPCALMVLAPAGRMAATAITAAFQSIRAARHALERSGERGGAVLLTVSRLDGRFGVEGLRPEIDPASGALAGLAKTAGREWPRVDCKALDLGDGVPPEQAARWIVEELLTRGPAEVGLDPSGRVRLELSAVNRPRDVAGRGRSVGPDDLVVISGGARGITAEAAVALAAALGPRILVLGRSPEPASAEPAGIAACRDEAALKHHLLAGPGRGRSPQAVGAQVRGILAEREVRRNLERIAVAGSRVIYRSVDVRDGAAVREAVRRARDEHGPVRGLIHGAGVLADRRIIDQTDAQFALVYDTKVRGLENLVAAIDPESLAFLVLFSSCTARFGRAGQVAYSAANEHLNKWAQQAAIRLPDCRVVSFNWGPWAGGMVGDSLRSVFENEGLHLIPPRAGARLVVDEIQNADGGRGPVEIVVLAEPAPADEASGAAAPDGALEPVLRRQVDPGISPPSWPTTSSTAVPCCRWRSSSSGPPRAPCIATRT